MIRAILAAVVLLSGCASYSEMQATEPLLELTTSKTPDAYAGCVMPKARELWRSMVTIAPDGQSQVISVATNASTLSTTTIAPRDDGSKVTFRAVSSMGVWGDEWPDDLRSCQ